MCNSPANILFQSWKSFHHRPCFSSRQWSVRRTRRQALTQGYQPLPDSLQSNAKYHNKHLSWHCTATELVRLVLRLREQTTDQFLVRHHGERTGTRRETRDRYTTHEIPSEGFLAADRFVFNGAARADTKQKKTDENALLLLLEPRPILFRCSRAISDPHNFYEEKTP